MIPLLVAFSILAMVVNALEGEVKKIIPQRFLNL